MLVDDVRITVPRAEVDEFLADWSPRLRGALGLVSSDGSVELPERRAPELVLTATFEPARAPRTDDRVHLQWRWQVDGRKDPVALHGPLPDLTGSGRPTTRVEAGSDPVTTAAGPGGGLAWFEDGTIDGADVAVFANELLPALPDHGVRTVVQGERQDYERLTGRPHIKVTTMPSDKHDWFDLGIFVTVNGKQVPFTPLLRALANRDRRMKLIDNSYLSLSDPAFDRLKELIEEARDLEEWEPDTPLTVTPLQAGLWSEFDQLADETEHDERWQRIAAGSSTPRPRGRPRAGHRARRAPALPARRLRVAALPARARHRRGARRRHGSRQDPAGARDDRRRPPGRAGRAAVPRRRPDLRRRQLGGRGRTVRAVPHGDHRHGDLAQGPGARVRAAAASDVVVTSYALLRLDAAEYREARWSALVLDEAQFVKNPQSQTHRAAAELGAPVTFAITGTPLENGLTDLWALFHVAAPGLLSSWSRFGDDYVKPLGSPDLRGEARAELTARLRRRIRPLMLRRTKESVAADLPPKQEQVVRVTLDPRTGRCTRRRSTGSG